MWNTQKQLNSLSLIKLEDIFFSFFFFKIIVHYLLCAKNIMMPNIESSLTNLS